MLGNRFGFRQLLLNTAAAAALGAVAMPSAMAQTWTLFEDFSATSLNVNKWMGEESKQYGGIRLESQRIVVSGQLRLYTRGYGDNVRNTGSSWIRNAVVLNKSASITALKSTITMRNAVGTTCAGNSNPDATTWRARMFGFFFNGGTPVSNTNMNDVFAGAQVYRSGGSTDPAGTYRISGFVGQCIDDSCISTTGIGTPVDLGTVTANTPVTLSIVWNKASKNFSFQRDANSPATITYTLNDSAPPEGSSAKRLEVMNLMAQCTAGRVGSSTTADFDNVYTNTLPTFSSIAPAAMEGTDLGAGMAN